MQCQPGDYAEGPFPCEYTEAEEKVDELEDWNWFDGAVEVFGCEIPEDFGPEESFHGRYDLIWKGELAEGRKNWNEFVKTYRLRR